jgi:alkylated DNA repair dioxygenase AlkB
LQDQLDKKKYPSVSGLILIENVIDWIYESQLIQEIDKQTWDTSLQRRVQQYGYRYNYRTKQVEESVNPEELKLSPLPPLPKWSLRLCQTFLDKGWILKLPNQLIINEYKVGQGINKHTDHKRFGDVIFSVSLGSPCTMIFRFVSVGPVDSVDPVEIRVKNRMFMKMEGEARHKWTHEIPPLRQPNARRISLTFRYVD